MGSSIPHYEFEPTEEDMKPFKKRPDRAFRQNINNWNKMAKDHNAKFLEYYKNKGYMAKPGSKPAVTKDQ